MPHPKRWQWRAEPGPMPTPCWIWTGAKNGKGYPQAPGRRRGGTRSYRPGKGWRWNTIPLFAHRLYREFFHGPIPDGFTVDHLCFRKLCVNPEHLDVCTGRENAQRWHRKFGKPAMAPDERRARKRELHRLKQLNPLPPWQAYRKPIGPQPKHNGPCKLTPEIVRRIRSEWTPGRPGHHNPNGYARPAKKYGVNPITIRQIVLRMTWREVPDLVPVAGQTLFAM